MKKILIIKAGSTIPSIVPRRGDFEDWIMTAMGLPLDRFSVVSVYQGQVLPSFSEVGAIIVTGSPAMVTDREVWSEYSARYLTDAVQQQIPVLGICYGHQLLAHALGGRVDFHPRGREIGTYDISLSEEGRQDLLFSTLGQSFPVHTTHSQTVTELPPGSLILAGNDFDPHHAVRFSKLAWGMQFHPEFDADIMRMYISERRQVLAEEGLDVDGLLAGIKESREGASLLKGFAGIIS